VLVIAVLPILLLVVPWAMLLVYDMTGGMMLCLALLLPSKPTSHVPTPSGRYLLMLWILSLPHQLLLEAALISRLVDGYCLHRALLRYSLSYSQ
jgi:hypothetical protein